MFVCGVFGMLSHTSGGVDQFVFDGQLTFELCLSLDVVKQPSMQSVHVTQLEVAKLFAFAVTCMSDVLRSIHGLLWFDVDWL